MTLQRYLPVLLAVADTCVFQEDAGASALSIRFRRQALAGSARDPKALAGSARDPKARKSRAVAVQFSTPGGVAYRLSARYPSRSRRQHGERWLLALDLRRLDGSPIHNSCSANGSQASINMIGVQSVGDVVDFRAAVAVFLFVAASLEVLGSSVELSGFEPMALRTFGEMMFSRVDMPLEDALAVLAPNVRSRASLTNFLSPI